MKPVSNTLEECPHVVAIAKILSDGKPHKPDEIGAALGLSSKNIRHYLQFMRDELRLPIKGSRAGFLVK